MVWDVQQAHDGEVWYDGEVSVLFCPILCFPTQK